MNIDSSVVQVKYNKGKRTAKPFPHNLVQAAKMIPVSIDGSVTGFTKRQLSHVLCDVCGYTPAIQMQISRKMKLRPKTRECETGSRRNSWVNRLTE